jgi:hypothetical protein
MTDFQPQQRRHKWYMSKYVHVQPEQSKICCLCGELKNKAKLPPCTGLPKDAEAAARMRETY